MDYAKMMPLSYRSSQNGCHKVLDLAKNYAQLSCGLTYELCLAKLYIKLQIMCHYAVNYAIKLCIKPLPTSLCYGLSYKSFP